MARLETITRGATFPLFYVHQEDCKVYTGDDLTVFFTVKTVEWDTVMDDSTAIIKSQSSTPDNDHTYDLSLSASQTSTPEPGSYFWDIRVRYPGGRIFKTIGGSVDIIGSPTNRSLTHD